MSTPKSASPESECSQDHPPSLICGSVPNQESTSFHQHFPTRDSTKKEANSSTNSQPVTQSRKRSAGKAFSSEQVEDDGVRARQKGKTDADSGDKTRRQLACPFQKLDSHKHHECLKYALHRIKDVKQHVYRRHKQPDYYCARCFEIFKTAETRDEHARRRSCDNLDTPGFEGISDEQRSKLNKSSSRGLDTQGQWFEMWDIIFPGKERPSSAWVGSYMEEMVPLLRSLWRNKSSSILAKALSKEKANTLDSGILDGVVGAIFDCLEAETSASLGRNARWSCTQGQVKLSDDQSPIPTPPSTFITDSTQFIFGEPQEMFPEFNITGQDEVFQNGFVFGESSASNCKLTSV
ncbi:hypothetical protein N8I77_003516 [Diaporthe amygdali]|uniref:C2H2-type domain-containing protein n=1 Tax=Phomopsis amygdali TaxID=1214568 RepID=A0AAD9W4Z6_PHOAM|nr:hypothetical protein N8I77_003516 [Diaporthe amygdali]